MRRTLLMARYDIDRLDNRDPEHMRAVMRLALPLLEAYFRPVVRGLERIPAGAGLYVGNHSGLLLTLDTFTLFGEVLRRRPIEDVPYGLGHEIAISLPILRDLIVPLGAVRASHDNAHRLFDGGHKVLVYPGSDYDSCRSHRDRDRIRFGPRRGYLRLALRAGVPIIPAVTAGSQEMCVVLHDGEWIAGALRLDKLFRLKVWPITLTVPWGLSFGPPILYWPLRTQFYQEILEPIRFDRQGEEAASDDRYVERCHQEVVETMQASLSRLAAERRAAQRDGPHGHRVSSQ